MRDDQSRKMRCLPHSAALGHAPDEEKSNDSSSTVEDEPATPARKETTPVSVCTASNVLVETEMLAHGMPVLGLRVLVEHMEVSLSESLPNLASPQLVIDLAAILSGVSPTGVMPHENLERRDCNTVSALPHSE